MSESAPHRLALLTPDEMKCADQLTMADGISGYELMRTAGRELLRALRARFEDASRVIILCGPGNNGGDGFVLARLLHEKGIEVKVGLLGEKSALKGDAATAFADWPGETSDARLMSLSGADLVIDALFGAGLSRPLDGEAAGLVTRLNESSLPVMAVDLPSGVNGKTGAAEGDAVKADLTVTFFRKKPGHLLQPGRAYCGEVQVRDIGIPKSVLDKLGVTLSENVPELWRDTFPTPDAAGHKYHRGHVLALSGSVFATGAARLSAKAALRVGAGLVTIAGAPDALQIHAAHLSAIMLKPAESAAELSSILDQDQRINSLIIGPGLGLTESAAASVQAALNWQGRLVLDADSITLLAQDGDAAFKRLKARQMPAILTPHDGEFKRLFSGISGSISKVERAREAADISGAVIVLKGADTVIAAPDGRAAINSNAPPWLATAGSGDVLAGVISGLYAQGMAAFEAAASGVWLHGQAANRLGRGMTADDLDTGLKDVLQSEDWKAGHGL